MADSAKAEASKLAGKSKKLMSLVGSSLKKTVGRDHSQEDSEFENERASFVTIRHQVEQLSHAITHIKKDWSNVSSADQKLTGMLSKLYEVDWNDSNEVQEMLSQSSKNWDSFKETSESFKALNKKLAEVEALKKLIEKRDRKKIYYDNAGGDQMDGQSFKKEKEKQQWLSSQQEYREVNAEALSRIRELRERHAKFITGYLHKLSGERLQLFRSQTQAWQQLEECFQRAEQVQFDNYVVNHPDREPTTPSETSRSLSLSAASPTSEGGPSNAEHDQPEPDESCPGEAAALPDAGDQGEDGTLQDENSAVSTAVEVTAEEGEEPRVEGCSGEEQPPVSPPDEAASGAADNEAREQNGLPPDETDTAEKTNGGNAVTAEKTDGGNTAELKAEPELKND